QHQGPGRRRAVEVAVDDEGALVENAGRAQGQHRGTRALPFPATGTRHKIDAPLAVLSAAAQDLKNSARLGDVRRVDIQVLKEGPRTVSGHARRSAYRC